MDDNDGGSLSKTNEMKNLLGERYSRLNPNIYEEEYVQHLHSGSHYDMTTFPRGRLVIVNIENFTYQSGLHIYPRKGTEKDSDALSDLFLSFGFTVDVFKDLNKDELLKVMRYTAQDSYARISALVIALLTHGQENYLFASDGRVEFRKITSFFRTSNLAGKPKIFIIQACQGSDYMEGLDEIDGKNRRTISFPAEADFLYAYSTAFGFYSWRNENSGSWFIQTLCEVFHKHARTMDIVQMLTRVNEIISRRKSHTGDETTDRKRQVTSTVSQLCKELYFFPPKKVYNEITFTE